MLEQETKFVVLSGFNWCVGLIVHGSEFFFSTQHSTYVQCILVLFHYLPQRTSFLLFSSCCVKSKVKCTLVQARKLCTTRTAHRGNKGIALLFLDHGARRGWGVSVTSRPLFTPGKDPVPIVQEVWWSPGPVWTGAENLAPHWDSIPGPSSQSLYWLHYPAHSCCLHSKTS
jgi:hypothetical protein